MPKPRIEIILVDTDVRVIWYLYWRKLDYSEEAHSPDLVTT